jgi:hypothetical protein
VLLVGGIVALSVFGFYEYVHADNIEFMDNNVAAAASAACQRLDTSLRARPPVGPKASNTVKAARLETEVLLITQLVEDVSRLGHKALADDIPSEDWLRDWQSLAMARATYAAQLKSGVRDATMREPQTKDHYPISRRMKDAAPGACVVVDELRGPI